MDPQSAIEPRPKHPGPPKYRVRLFLGLALLLAALGVTAWAAWAAVESRQGLPQAGDPPLAVRPDGFARCGVRSVGALVLAMGSMLCGWRPVRRARGAWAALGLAEVALGALLLPVLMLVYWLGWSPLVFIT